MASPFLMDLSLPGMPGRYQLYISETALRFADQEEQNMKIIPRNCVSTITIRDTDRTFSTTDMPKALACTGVGGVVSGLLARRSMYGIIHSTLDGSLAIGPFESSTLWMAPWSSCIPQEMSPASTAAI
ncbi:unnamed protein product [Durusdinium trenchii]|uniref:Altered inheritance of mitochondria protein 24, mitochondrial n=1 Tax=Durusdinium trenchii TaxID=1381693 RepID=A0ABP0LH33_9DINO